MIIKPISSKKNDFKIKVKTRKVEQFIKMAKLFKHLY